MLFASSLIPLLQSLAAKRTEKRKNKKKNRNPEFGCDRIAAVFSFNLFFAGLCLFLLFTRPVLLTTFKLFVLSGFYVFTLNKKKLNRTERQKCTRRRYNAYTKYVNNTWTAFATRSVFGVYVKPTTKKTLHNHTHGNMATTHTWDCCRRCCCCRFQCSCAFEVCVT